MIGKRRRREEKPRKMEGRKGGRKRGKGKCKGFFLPTFPPHSLAAAFKGLPFPIPVSFLTNRHRVKGWRDAESAERKEEGEGEGKKKVHTKLPPFPFPF